MGERHQGLGTDYEAYHQSVWKHLTILERIWKQLTLRPRRPEGVHLLYFRPVAALSPLQKILLYQPVHIASQRFT